MLGPRAALKARDSKIVGHLNHLSSNSCLKAASDVDVTWFLNGVSSNRVGRAAAGTLEARDSKIVGHLNHLTSNSCLKAASDVDVTWFLNGVSSNRMGRARLALMLPRLAKGRAAVTNAYSHRMFC